MTKPNKQAVADHRKRREAQGLKRKELYCHPMDWNEIKAFADSKANRRELIDSTPNNSELEHVDQPVKGEAK